MSAAVSVAAAVAGAVVTMLALRTLPSGFERPPHARSNYRGRTVVGTAGVVLIAPLLLGALLALGEEGSTPALACLGLGAWTGALGYIDDVYGDRHAGGLFGHARELVRGRLTTGSAKALGGAAGGLLAAWVVGREGLWIVAAGAVVALSANLMNLVDLRPGRAIKVWLPCAVALIFVGMPGRSERVLVALVWGVAVFGYWELGERVMLGDTGAGLLGGVLGVATISSVDRTPLLVVLGVLSALTLASEFVSFTRVIDSVPPLRWIDALGRRRD